MPRATLSLACLWWLTLVGVVSAQPSLNANDPGVASLQNFSGGVSFNGTYFQVQNVAGNGVGWRNGFTQLGLLSPYWVNDDLVVAFNGRLLITDTQQIGGNLGGLIRHYNSDWDRILGANAYYDLDQSIYNNNYRQGTFGLESLGQWWDFRANGYVPTSSGTNFLHAVGLGQDPFFFGNRVGFLGVGLYEQSLYGGDFEFGTPLTPETPWLRGYSGMYFYRGNGNGVDPVGYRGRVEGWLSDDLSLGVNVTYDKQFGTNVNCVVNFLFSGWKPTRWFPNFTTRDRMLTPVQRNWRIATSQYNQKVEVPAFNPATGQPYFVTWVDDSRVLPGNGTYERPFNFMPAADPRADLILVRAGNTSAANPLQSSITLRDGQRLLGEGLDHKFDAYASFGSYTNPVKTYSLPDAGFTNTGLSPYLTSLAGNAVTIANNNEVSAFNILNSFGAGIANVPTGSQNFNLNHLNLTNNNGGGIVLTDASGTGRIDTVTAQDNAAGGIYVDSGATPLLLTLQDVTSNGTPGGGQLFGVSINADNAGIDATLNNVIAQGNGTGLIFTETNSSLLAKLNNVNATGNVGDGLFANGLGGSIDLRLDTVDTSSNGGRGIFVNGDGTDIAFTAVDLTDNTNGDDNINFTLINGSTLSGRLVDTHFDGSLAGSGIVLKTDTGSSIGSAVNPFVLENVTGDSNNQFGLQLSAQGGSSQYIHVVDGSFSLNGIDGINQVESGGSHVTLYVDPTTIDGNQRDGYHFELSDGSTASNEFVQDTLNDNGRSAIYGEVDLIGTGSSQAWLTLTDTTGLRSGADGLRVNSDQGAFVAVSVTNGDFSDSGQATAGSSAVRFDAIDSTINLQLLNTPGANTNLFPAGPQEFGLQANLNNTVFNATVTDGNFSDNLQDGIRILADNFSAARLDLQNVVVDNNGLDGMNVRSANGSAFTANVTDSSFSNNGRALTTSGQGLDLGVDGTVGAASLTVNLANTTVDSNELEGILGNAVGSPIRAGLLVVNTFEGTTVDNNGATGVLLNGTNAVIQASFTDSDISSNIGNGVVYNGTGLGASPSSVTFTNTGISGTTDFNGGDGFRFNVLGGNILNLSASFADFSSNSGRGINGTVDGVGSTVTINQFLGVTADSNDQEGLKLLVDNSGVLNGNINGGSFSNNGQAGAYDGVNVVVDHNGTATICFDGTAVDSNTDDGFDFAAQNGGTLNVGLQTSGQYGTLSASNNNDQAVVYNVGAGSTGNLFMNGANTFNGNGSSTAAISYVANGAAVAAFGFSGTSDGNAGDAVNVQMTNVADAYIDIHGSGSLSNNGGNGVDVELNGVTFGNQPLAVNFIQGTFTANPFRIANLVIQQNGDEGILVNANNVTMPVGEISGNTIASSGLNGSGEAIRINTTGGTFGQFDILNNGASANAGSGINLTSNGTNFTTLSVNGNVVLGNSSDGVLFDMTNSPVATLNFKDNTVGLNDGHGVNFDLTGSPIQTVNITGNSIGETTGSTGFLDDSTPVIRAGFNANQLPRQDDTGSIQTPVGFNMNFFGQLFSQLWVNPNGNVSFNNPVSTFTPDPIVTNGIPMLAPFWADVDTRDDGQPVTFGTGTIAGQNAFGVNWVDVNYYSGAHPGQHNSFQLVVIDRSDVGAGDFDFEFNYSQITWETGNASGGTNGLGGDSARVGYTNGSSASFELPGSAVNGAFLDSGPAATRLVGNSIDSANLGRYRFAVRNGIVGGGGASSNTGDNIHFDQVNSSIANLNITDNTINNAGANGINFNTVTNSNLTNVDISRNTISGNTNDGVRLIDPTLPALTNTVNLTMNDNTIDLNGGNGVNLELHQGQTMNLAMAGNTIGTTGNGNTGMGVRADVSSNSSINVNLGSNVSGANANSFTANHDAGFGLTMSDNSTGSLMVVNSSFTDTTDGANASFAGVGLGVIMSDNAALNPVIIGDVAAQNTSFNNNASDGLLINMLNTSSIGGPLQLLNVQADGNGTETVPANGVHIREADSAVIGSLVPSGQLNLRVVGNTAGAEMSNNNGNGLQIERVADASLNSVEIGGMTFDSNTADGINLTHTGGVVNNTPTIYSIHNNTITNNTGNGINLTQLSSARTVDFINQNTITGNQTNGILISLNQAAALGDPSGTLGVGGNPSFITSNTFANNGNAAGEAAINVQVNAGDNLFNDAYVNLHIGDETGRQTFDGDQNGIIINNNSSFHNGAPPANVVSHTTVQIYGQDLANIVNNGIQITNTGVNGSNITGEYLIGKPSHSVTISNFGTNGTGNGIAFGGGVSNLTIDNTQITHAVGSTGGADGIHLELAGGDTVTIQNSTILRSGGDGIDISDNAAFNNVTIRSTHSDQNAGRGLLVNIQGDGGGTIFGQTFAGSVYNVGNLADTGANRNSFSSNGLQGMLFLQRAATDGSASFSAQDINFPAGNLIPANRFDTNSPDNLITLFNVVNNDINSNGNLGLATGDSDGSVFLVGTNTRMVMNYSGNGRQSSPGVPVAPGNLGDDFRLAPIVSVNPADSSNPGPDNSPPQAGDGVDTYVFDPVAHVNLLFGGNRILGFPFPAAGQSASPGPFNFGEQINVSNTGFAPSGIAGVQTVFTNNDVFKGTNRSTIMSGETYLQGQLNNNIYIQNGVTQNVNNVFNSIFTISPSPFP